MEMRRAMTILFPQCQQPRKQHDQVLAAFHWALAQRHLAIAAKKPGLVQDNCRKLKRKEEQNAMTTKKEYPKCLTCDKTNQPAERCGKGAGAHLKPKDLKLVNSKSEEKTLSQEDSTCKPTTSTL